MRPANIHPRPPPLASRPSTTSPSQPPFPADHGPRPQGEEPAEVPRGHHAAPRPRPALRAAPLLPREPHGARRLLLHRLLRAVAHAAAAAPAQAAHLPLPQEARRVRQVGARDRRHLRDRGGVLPPPGGAGAERAHREQVEGQAGEGVQGGRGEARGGDGLDGVRLRDGRREGEAGRRRGERAGGAARREGRARGGGREEASASARRRPARRSAATLVPCIEQSPPLTPFPTLPR